MSPRFYLPAIRETGQIVSLGGEEFFHLKKVLRLHTGDEISLFDGKGTGFAGRILEVGRTEARVVLGPREPAERESALHLTLVVTLSKGEKFEWVVQKATELGVSVIEPVYTERADVRPVGGREEKKTERWRRVALEACKQSGRTRLPVIRRPGDLGSAMTRPEGEVGIVLDPEGPPGSMEGLLRSVAGAEALAVVVGPEGGWSPREREQFHEAGFLRLRLGPRILRTETAAIVSTALFQFLSGDLVTGWARPPFPGR